MITRVERVKLIDVYKGVLVRIGNYLAEDELREREFPFSKFVELVEFEVLPVYRKFIFKGGYVHAYVTSGTPFVFPDPAPELVSKVLPVTVYGVGMLALGEVGAVFRSSSRFMPPRVVVLWRYEKPKLYVAYHGDVEIECYWTLDYDRENREVEVEVDSKDVFNQLCAGAALVALGRSRRAVRIGDSNIEFDAEEMVVEGEELLNNAKERLKDLGSIQCIRM